MTDGSVTSSVTGGGHDFLRLFIAVILFLALLVAVALSGGRPRTEELRDHSGKPEGDGAMDGYGDMVTGEYDPLSDADEHDTHPR